MAVLCFNVSFFQGTVVPHGSAWFHSALGLGRGTLTGIVHALDETAQDSQAIARKQRQAFGYSSFFAKESTGTVLNSKPTSLQIGNFVQL